MTVLSTLACVVSDTGIFRPQFLDILDTLYSRFKSIYGDDSYIAPDSQDGQLLAAVAKAIDDSNAAAVAVYNSFSPATGQGAALSNNVKINGMARSVATNSTVPVRVTGQVGTVINGGIVTDTAGNAWVIPNGTLIPGAGYADVTATAQNVGAISAATGTITGIQTPTLGWQSVTNTGPAVPGSPVESDAQLRMRQAISVALPSRTVLDGILGAVAACVGVSQARIYENDTGTTDGNGIPAHTVAVVTVGGVNTDIATAIMLKKTPGTGTAGTSSVALTTPGGTPVTIKYYPASARRIIVSMQFGSKPGYVSSIGTAAVAAVAAYISALGIGQKVDVGKLYLPAQLFGGEGSQYYDILSLGIAFYGGTIASADLGLAFNEVATCVASDISLTVY